MKNKKVKVWYMGKRLRDLYPHATKWEMFTYRLRIFFRNLVILGFIVLAFYATYRIGGELNPATIYTKAEVVVEVPIKAPVLERIATCESGGSHYDKNGQVQFNANTNGSVDIGKYQINNKAWGKKATDMKLNLVVEEDNKKMAQYIYETHGTEPWYSSKKCWNK